MLRNSLWLGGAVLAACASLCWLLLSLHGKAFAALVAIGLLLVLLLRRPEDRIGGLLRDEQRAGRAELREQLDHIRTLRLSRGAALIDAPEGAAMIRDPDGQFVELLEATSAAQERQRKD